jgi:hypothetical protein
MRAVRANRIAPARGNENEDEDEDEDEDEECPHGTKVVNNAGLF